MRRVISAVAVIAIMIWSFGEMTPFLCGFLMISFATAIIILWKGKDKDIRFIMQVIIFRILMKFLLFI
jgi:hypothetical protein